MALYNFVVLIIIIIIISCNLSAFYESVKF